MPPIKTQNQRASRVSRRALSRVSRRAGRTLALGLTTLLLGFAGAGVAAEPEVTQLSDERTVTQWAHIESRAPVLAEPNEGARPVSRLRFDTEDGLPEIYVMLRQHVGPDGRPWVEVRIPARPNGQTGWVQRGALGPARTVRTQLRIDRRRLRATLYRSGKRIWSARVGIGKRGSPTPAGNFYIRERISNLRGSPVYGPLAFGTSAYSRISDWPGGGVVGIHGTNQPNLIPGRPSHGCVRVRNASIRRLARLMPLGTPVVVE